MTARSHDQTETREFEASLLRIARERGLVDHDESTRIDELVRRGAIDRATLADLALTMIEGRTTQQPAPTPNLESWDRYDDLRFLGSGGMGRVYTAYDPRLKRHVVLKFLHSDEAEHERRFAREAQAQARVEHDHVCRIYEVGEVQRRPFIAMQYIRGRSLGDAAVELSIDETLRIMAQVASAIHAAHRTGLIHRDIKPGNIMLEEREGGWHPYVLDFGLAIEPSQSDTATGLVAGTPAYMAPEQVQGSTQALDRRTDVYALGATLFAVLSGTPPFSGASSVDVLMQVLEKDAPPLRSKNPRIPEDVATIVAKCLEKDPSRRYGSAKELADDLQRYLDGEPITARPASLTYRGWKWVRRHRAVSTISALALLVIAGLLGYGLQLRQLSREQAAIAQELGQEVREIETIHRAAVMAPVHPIAREERIIRERMAAISEQRDVLGRASRGPVSYALGRGAYILGEYAQARAHLESAWQLPYRTEQVALALGDTMAALYHAAIEQLRTVASSDLREAERQRIHRELGDPALAMLRRGATARSAGSRAEVQIALLEERYDDALEIAERAAEQTPWLYELLLDQAHALSAQGRELTAHGQLDEAIEVFHGADQKLLEAIDLARSSLQCHQVRSSLWIDILKAEGERSGAVDAALEEIRRSTDVVLQIEPENWEALHDLAAATLIHSELQARRGIDPTAAIDEAVALAGRAARSAPDNPQPHNVAGTAMVNRTQWAVAHGEDPTPYLTAAIEELATAIELAPGAPFPRQNLGNAHYFRGQYRSWTGHNPEDDFRAAIAAYESVLEITPDVALVYSNIGAVWTTLGDWHQAKSESPSAAYSKAVASLEKGLLLNPGSVNTAVNLANAAASLGSAQINAGNDPVDVLDRAVEAADLAISLNPEFALAHLNRGKAWLHLAEYRQQSSDDSTACLDEAERSYRRALELNPGDALTPLHLGLVHLYRASWGLLTGLDPSAALSAAEESFTVCANRNSAWVYPFNFLAQTELARARWQLLSDGDPTGALKDVRTWLTRARQVQSVPESSLLEARSYTMEARWLVRQDRSPEEAVSLAVQIVDQVTEDNPDLAEARVIAATAEASLAEWLGATGQQPLPIVTRAQQRLDRASRSETPVSDLQLAIAECARLEAEHTTGRQRSAAISQGLAACSRQLDKTPNDAEVLLTQARLLALDNQVDRARTSLNRAIELNPLLRPYFADVVDLIAGEEPDP